VKECAAFLLHLAEAEAAALKKLTVDMHLDLSYTGYTNWSDLHAWTRLSIIH